MKYLHDCVGETPKFQTRQLLPNIWLHPTICSFYYFLIFFLYFFEGKGKEVGAGGRRSGKNRCLGRIVETGGGIPQTRTVTSSMIYSEERHQGACVPRQRSALGTLSRCLECPALCLCLLRLIPLLALSLQPSGFLPTHLTT